MEIKYSRCRTFLIYPHRWAWRSIHRFIQTIITATLRLRMHVDPILVNAFKMTTRSLSSSPLLVRPTLLEGLWSQRKMRAIMRGTPIWPITIPNSDRTQNPVPPRRECTLRISSTVTRRNIRVEYLRRRWGYPMWAKCDKTSYRISIKTTVCSLRSAKEHRQIRVILWIHLTRPRQNLALEVIAHLVGHTTANTFRLDSRNQIPALAEHKVKTRWSRTFVRNNRNMSSRRLLWEHPWVHETMCLRMQGPWSRSTAKATRTSAPLQFSKVKPQMSRGT